MNCKLIKTKKYILRNSPPYSAQDCPNITKKGQHKHKNIDYISIPDKNKIYKWVIATNKSSKNGGKSIYNIEHNGDILYRVTDYSSNKYVIINKQSYDKKTHIFH